MKCKKVELLLSEYLAGELESAREASVKLHLKKCPDCAQKLAGLAELQNRINAIPLPEIKDEQFFVNLPNVIRRQISPKRLRDRLPLDYPLRLQFQPRYALIAAVLLLAVILSFINTLDFGQKAQQMYVQDLSSARQEEVPEWNLVYASNPWMDSVQVASLVSPEEASDVAEAITEVITEEEGEVDLPMDLVVFHMRHDMSDVYRTVSSLDDKGIANLISYLSSEEERY